MTVGRDAQGEVTVQLEHEGELHRGRGISTDCVEASAIAFLSGINRIIALRKLREARETKGEG